MPTHKYDEFPPQIWQGNLPPRTGRWAPSCLHQLCSNVDHGGRPQVPPSAEPVLVYRTAELGRFGIVKTSILNSHWNGEQLTRIVVWWSYMAVRHVLGPNPVESVFECEFPETCSVLGAIGEYDCGCKRYKLHATNSHWAHSMPPNAGVIGAADLAVEDHLSTASACGLTECTMAPWLHGWLGSRRRRLRRQESTK